MGDRIVNKSILREDSPVTTLQMLFVFGEVFEAEAFLIYIFQLACYDIDFLVVIFVHRSGFSTFRLHSLLLHGCCLIFNFGFTKFHRALHQLNAIFGGSRPLETLRRLLESVLSEGFVMNFSITQIYLNRAHRDFDRTLGIDWSREIGLEG